MKRRIVILAIALLPAAWASGEDDLQQFAPLRGVVLDATDNRPLGFANIIIMGTSRGAMTLDNGHFTVQGVPLGPQRVKIMHRGYQDMELEVFIEEGGTSLKDLRINRLPDYVPVDRDSVGADIFIDASDVSCDLMPVRQPLRVGDSGKFDVVLRNGSNETFYLVQSLDESDWGNRYPHTLLTIEGPPGGVVTPFVPRCGFMSRIEVANFILVEPGDYFYPYGRSWVKMRGTFAKPGRYVVRFRYSTDETNYGRWMGSSFYIDGAPKYLLDLFKRVPLLDLECSVVVEVED